MFIPFIITAIKTEPKLCSARDNVRSDHRSFITVLNRIPQHGSFFLINFSQLTNRPWRTIELRGRKGPMRGGSLLFYSKRQEPFKLMYYMCTSASIYVYIKIYLYIYICVGIKHMYVVRRAPKSMLHGFRAGHNRYRVFGISYDRNRISVFFSHRHGQMADINFTTCWQID